MSDNAVIAAGAALLGAFLGSLAPVVTSIIQSRAERRRERMRLAVQLAIEQQRMWLEIGKQQKIEFPPLMISLFTFADILADVARDKQITPQRLAQMLQNSTGLRETLQELHDISPE